MLQEGNRKVVAFYFTMILMWVTFLVGLLFSIQFTGDNIMVMMVMFATLAGAFFGANFGEHWSQARKSGNGQGA